jgi:hypothetical protein
MVCNGGGWGLGGGRTEETRRAREIVCCAFVMITMGMCVRLCDDAWKWWLLRGSCELIAFVGVDAFCLGIWDLGKGRRQGRESCPWELPDWGLGIFGRACVVLIGT